LKSFIKKVIYARTIYSRAWSAHSRTDCTKVQRWNKSRK